MLRRKENLLGRQSRAQDVQGEVCLDNPSVVIDRMTNRGKCGLVMTKLTQARARFARRRVGKVLIDLPDFLSARRISYKPCRFSQNSGVVPEKCARRSAASPVMARPPWRVSVMRHVSSPGDSGFGWTVSHR